MCLLLQSRLQIISSREHNYKLKVVKYQPHTTIILKSLLLLLLLQNPENNKQSPVIMNTEQQLIKQYHNKSYHKRDQLVIWK